jgi:Domain of unknown function (DUF4142)
VVETDRQTDLCSEHAKRPASVPGLGWCKGPTVGIGSALSGAAFDKAYADNEAAYHKSVDDALSNTLIPDAQNAELKSLLESGLKIFQDHLRDAQNMVKELSVAHQ